MGKKKQNRQEEQGVDFGEAMHMIEDNGGLPFFESTYALDLNAICDFINYADKNEVKEIAITDASAENIPIDSESAHEIGTMEAISKNMTTHEVREARGHTNQQMDALRYDLVKILLNYMLTSSIVDDDGMINIGTAWGLSTVVNTMVQHKFLYNMKDRDLD